MTEESVTPSASDKSLGMWCHLSGLSGLFTGGVGTVVGPLVLWLVKKDESEWVDYHGKEALNFGITAMIAQIVAGVLCIVLIGLLLLPVVFIGWIVYVAIASSKANEGVRYKYPYCLRLVK